MKINTSPAYNTTKTPSFGGALSTLGGKIINNKTLTKFSQGIEFDKFNMSVPVMCLTMFGAVLVPRLKNAQSDMDREEILRRDVTSVSTIVFGVPALTKIFSKVCEKKTGFVLSSKPKEQRNVLQKVFDYVRPVKGVNVLTSEGLTSRYTNLEGYKDGIYGFFDWVKKDGGDLKKVLSFDKGVKTSTEQILGNGKKLADSTHEEIVKAFKSAEGTEKLSGAVKNVLGAFKDKDNVFVTRAKALNSTFGLISMFVLVPAFLGFGLPLLNEHITKKKMAQRAAEQKPLTKTMNTLTSTFLNAQNSSNAGAKKTFGRFLV